MGSGSILRRTLSFLLLAALTPLAGCFQFESNNIVSWSPSGRRVAFIARSKAWVYDMASGALTALPSRREPSGVSWSPSEGLIATSTAGLVELYVEPEPGVFASSSAFVMPFLGSDALSVLMWHPSGRKLLDAQFADNKGETTEIDVSSHEAVRLGTGVGVYGPNADWLMWAAVTSIGKRDNRPVFDRQSPAGDTLPLDAETARVLDSDFFDLMATQDQAARQPVCSQHEDAQRGRTDVYCLDAQGDVRRRGSLPASSATVFPDQSRRLFAVVEEKNDEEPTLTIYDGEGRRQADGKDFLNAARGPEASKSPRASRLAWSPDGNWLAWVVGGRLCLWNWRNNAIRVHAPPA